MKKTITVELPASDAIAVGMSLRALAKLQRTPPSTSEAYTRVGDKLVEAYKRSAGIL